MSLDHLWAGWRAGYVSSFEDGPATDSGEQECIFCAILATPARSDRERLVVFSGETVVAILNAYPYAPGHVMVMPRRHLRRLDELSPQESTDLWESLRAAVRAIEAAYRPEGCNVGANLGRAAGAGIPDHLHLHAVPRWVGDTNFMTSLAGVRVLPEPLDLTWERIHSAWA